MTPHAASRIIAVWGLAAVAASCTPDYLRVYVEGDDFDLTVSPIDVQVAVAGGGQGTSFAYTASLVAPRAGIANLPYSDFLLEFGAGASSPIDIRVGVPAGTGWGGDVRVTLPAAARAVHIPLSPGEQPVASSRIVDGDLTSVAAFSTGLAFAWPHPEGVAIRVVRSADSLLGRERVLVDDAAASKVRVASRPTSSGFGPDLFAIAWRGVDGLVSVRPFTQLSMNLPALALGAGQDVRVACARKGGSYDIAALRLDGGAVSAMLVSAAGDAVGGPFPVATDGMVTAIVGATTLLDYSVVVALRTLSGSRLVRINADGSPGADVMLAGDARALATSADGTRLLVAIAGVDAKNPQLAIGSFFATTLAPAGSPTAVAPFAFAGDGLKSQVSLSDCVVSWPEERGDGTHVIDLRYQYLDPSGQPFGDTHLVNVDLNGDHFSPTVVCESSTRAYVAFLDRTDRNSDLGGLRVRRVPASP